MKKSIVLNFYGGPGVGKSTTATKVYALLKSNYKKCEYVHEFVKDWVWEERKILDTDQVLILANQHRKERLLYGKVDIIVTDSPMWLVPIYEKILTKPPFVTEKIIEKYLKSSPNVEHKHIFLKRFFKYDETGRYQNLEQALEIDDKIRNFLIKKNLDFIEVEARPECELDIVNKLNLM